MMNTDHALAQSLSAEANAAGGTPVPTSNSDVEACPLISTDGAESAQRRAAMAEFGITHDGRSYQYNGYQYDRLADALAYAELVRSHPSQDHAVGPFAPHRALIFPTAAELVVMGTLGISFEAGTYRFKDFRYDQLADAVSYAALNQ